MDVLGQGAIENAAFVGAKIVERLQDVDRSVSATLAMFEAAA